ncbi:MULTISPECIES: ABC transporter ATP-binding protein [Virgibacillus]|uniref:Carnitine transport ATP-binding protein OpuCA n=1 Tax=Virgibacillus dokdonensis TaxID=302167 RepID=A0A2K9J3G4_9BACI|nr:MULTISPECIES: ABC transporter ATP-binding protein [Virgibacillus]AUJ26502.1 Carnitine transport ATP-binding protein OpuCA [Virgibacillus dokdonensis]NWO13597.1 ABC transporter ATP-binding protein [Virgibacillus sp.]
MIEFNQVYKTYPDGTEAVKDISFQVEKGEFITLIGPSGCGKTTTIKMVNRLMEPTSGDIYIKGENIRAFPIDQLRWNIGYVLQEIALFPHMTIEENIAVVPELKKWDRRRIRNRSKELLEMVGLDPSMYKKKLPVELSGGQQQRIGVIRALAGDPDIILMDEPFSALDPISRQQLQTDIQRLQQEVKKTILFVTHDIKEAMALGDRVCLMNEGEIVQFDTPDNLVRHPKTTFVKEFTGKSQSPWETPVETIASSARKHILSRTALKQGEYDPNLLYIIEDENNNYVGMVKQGRTMEGIQLQHNLPLSEVVHMTEEVDQDFFPIVKENKLVGVFQFRDMVAYLKDQSLFAGGSEDE